MLGRTWADWWTCGGSRNRGRRFRRTGSRVGRAVEHIRVCVVVDELLDIEPGDVVVGEQAAGGGKSRRVNGFQRKSRSAGPHPHKSVNPVTTSGDAGPAASTVTALAAVVARPQTPPLEGLQLLPVIGPNFVPPIVGFIAQIPLIGDVLHPLIGYQLQPGLPAGTPAPRDVEVISFDGTPIYVHFMPAVGVKAGQQAPTILEGPGLALPGATNPAAAKDEFLPNQVIGILPLRQDGYNVVTWDPRGEWNSGGQLQIDSPDFEAKGVSAIIGWLATQPEVDLNGPGDPKIGMVGASYGGGIQLVAAATDPRIDAIVPTIAWHSLNTSLYKNQAFKSS